MDCKFDFSVTDIGLQVYSIDSTSLPHSLLFVSTPPLILAAWARIRGETLSLGELGGLALGLAGALVIAAGHMLHAHSEHEVTLGGDAAAFLAAVGFVIYLSLGRHLRGGYLGQAGHCGSKSG